MKRRTFMSVLLAGSVAACNQSQLLVIRGRTMGTTYTVKLIPRSNADSPGLLRAKIEHVLASVNEAMSTYEPHSELSRFNRIADTGWVHASDELFRVIERADHVSTLTDGAFDATVAPLVNLWGFGPTLRAAHVPSDDAIRRSWERVGYRQLRLDPDTRTIGKGRNDVHLDLSSIAKGYAVDRVTELLDRRGGDDYMVEIGGDMRVKGTNAHGRNWRIAIEAPTPPRRTVSTTLTLGNDAVATSGNYRDFFEQGGRRYPHIIDPRRAEPVEHPLTSVTVVAESAMEADALATAMLVLGPDRGYLFAQAQNVAALYVTRAGDGLRIRGSDAIARFRTS